MADAVPSKSTNSPATRVDKEEDAVADAGT